MGKANRKLTVTVNAHYAERNKKYTETTVVDGRVVNTKSPHRLHIEKVYDTALAMQVQLTDYSQRGGYSLCEYLDLHNLENYILWLHGTTLG